ncbi:MAG: hypothetical protein H6705_11495 [Myxococcales bacterium]|nr:hypothetical protein [Myxococcales bacterium]
MLIQSPLLDAARSLEATLRARHPAYGRLDGFDGYGSGPDRYVCTTFCMAVLEAAGYPLDEATRARIDIRDFRPPLEDAVARGDDEITGVAWALESAGLGARIAPAAIAAGDFMQYWYRSADGRLLGHVGLVAERLPDGVRLYGAHKSTRGVAIHPDVIRLDNKVALYAVRPHPPPLTSPS